MDKEEFKKKFNLTEKQFVGEHFSQKDIFRIKYDEMPEGFSPKTKYHLFFENLEKMPINFCPKTLGSLDLSSLKELSENFSPFVKENLHLNYKTINIKIENKLETSYVTPNFQNVEGIIYCGNACRFNLKGAIEKSPDVKIFYFC
jgi:hypothetical protein